MHKNIIGLSLALLLLLIGACNQKDEVFESRPSERYSQQTLDLQQTLVEAPYGWQVIYFPKADSLLYTNASERISIYEGTYGYGGVSFQMKFNSDGQVTMLADWDETTISSAKTSQYRIGHNMYTQLSFSTYTYIHRLVNDQYEGASDFLYWGKNLDGDLVFRTSRSIDPAREYMVMHRLEKEENWQNDEQKAYDNRKFFEKMVNPQIRIYRGGRTFFESDYYLKRDVSTNQNILSEIPTKRYYLFLSVLARPQVPGNRPKLGGLGSGYTGTANGISFYPGIRLDKTNIFYDFQRVGDKFEAELVSVYDPYWKITRLVSKHLAPEGEFTGMKAVIWDAGHVESTY